MNPGREPSGTATPQRYIDAYLQWVHEAIPEQRKQPHPQEQIIEGGFLHLLSSRLALSSSLDLSGLVEARRVCWGVTGSRRWYIDGLLLAELPDIVRHVHSLLIPHVIEKYSLWQGQVVSTGLGHSQQSYVWPIAEQVLLMKPKHQMPAGLATLT